MAIINNEFNNTLGLYIHIPFCKTICSYCDFPKLVSKRENQKKYIEYLKEEIYNNMVKLKNIDTVYIGGGTPNSIDLDLLEEILFLIKDILSNSKENSIELNPELVTPDLCSLLYKYNINRASLGVQTLNDKSIKLLNRHHDKNIVIKAVEYLKDAGINNINIDLIFGIPNTTIADIDNDLDFILRLGPTHISYYSLILEDKTVFNYLYNHDRLKLLDDDYVADMYEHIREVLYNKGFHHYEISNFSLPGYESKHNLKYWDTLDYLGFGLGAASLYRGRRFTNSYRMDKYLMGMKEEEQELSLLERKDEFMMLGLRKTDGISIRDYKNRFNSDIYSDFKLDKMINQGLLIIDGDRIYINPKHLFIANLVFEEFVGDSDEA